MKVVAYSIQPFEKELLIKSNQKKHDITLISNPITVDTVGFAEGKNAVIISENDVLTAPLIDKLAAMGVQFITTRSTNAAHVDKKAAAKAGLKLANVPAEFADNIAAQTIRNLDLWQAEKCVGKACICAHNCRGKEPQPHVDKQLNYLP